MIPALSFVPVQDVILAFDELCNHCGIDEQPVLDYFETNYIGEQRRGRRLPPIFPHELWNMHNRALNELPRPNNNLEGWHNRFSTMFRQTHPSIWEFIDTLKLDVAHNRIIIIIISEYLKRIKHVSFIFTYLQLLSLCVL